MARNAPGLTPSELRRMTPEETRYLRSSLERELKAETEFQITLAKVSGGLARLIGG